MTKTGLAKSTSRHRAPSRREIAKPTIFDLLTLRPIGSLGRLKRPLSRGSDLLSYPCESLVSFRINRQLSGWNPPPQVIRAFGAHCQKKTFGSFDWLMTSAQ